MSRVDENRDAQRVAEQKAMEKAAQKKSDEEQGRLFAAVMAHGRKAAREQAQGRAAAHDRGQATRSQARGQAANALLARQGIVANHFAAELQRHGTGKIDRNHGEAVARSDDLVQERGQRASEQEVRIEDKRGEERELRRAQDRLAPIQGDEERRGSGDGAGSGMGGGDAGGSGDQRGAELAQQAPAAAMMPASGSPTQRAQGAAGEPATRMRDMIEQLVKHVMTGVDKKGLGVMRVELKDDVLGGANLLITAGDGGVSLKVNTQDETARRLLSSGQTAHELSAALQSKGIRLNSLEVNEEKVVRS